MARRIPDFIFDGPALCFSLSRDGRANADWWFPATKGEAARAKRICRRCELLAPCRSWGRSEREWGVWGGESEWDRRKLGITPAPANIEEFLT